MSGPAGGASAAPGADALEAAEAGGAGDAPGSRGRGRFAWPLAGAGALVLGTLLGRDDALLAAVAGPPDLVRAALVGASVVAALWLLAGALRRLEAGRAVADPGARQVGELIRGVRLVFLAVAALAAAAGWLLGHPLPFVVALVIAGVDVLETSLLLLVASARGGRGA